MNSKNLEEANNIERELWALRAAIRQMKSLSEIKQPPSRESQPAQHA